MSSDNVLILWCPLCHLWNIRHNGIRTVGVVALIRRSNEPERRIALSCEEQHRGSASGRRAAAILRRTRAPAACDCASVSPVALRRYDTYLTLITYYSSKHEKC